MSFDIRIDTRFDSSGFFDDPEALAALERAAGIWEGILLDEFDDVPAGIAFEIDDPSQAGTTRRVVLDRPIDDLLLFVGAQELLGASVAVAGYDGTGDGGSTLGDAYSARVSRDFRGQGPVTDFEPWVGTVTFDPTADWSFDLDGPQPGRTDFVTVALHEIGHVLGFGTAPIFDRIGAGGEFDGPNTLRVAGEPVPLQEGLGHVEEGYAGDSVLMDPQLRENTRVLPTDIDRAMLADIGWEIAGFEAQGATPALATAAGERIFGSAAGDALDGLAGDDQIQGRDGDDAIEGGDGADSLFGQNGDDTIRGGAGDDQVQGGPGDDLIEGGGGGIDTVFGQTGTDVFRMKAGGGTLRIQDYELGVERIEIEGAGFASAAEAAAAITKPFSNVSRLTFADGTRIDVFHDPQDGTPLAASDFLLVDPGPPPVEGGAGSDDLIGTAAAEALRGLGGDDTLDGRAGADSVDGGAGIDVWAASGPAGVAVDLAARTARDGFGDVDRLTSVEGARGAAAGDRLTGDGGANRLDGLGGDDTLDGGAGGDDLRGGDGGDVLEGGAGDDRLDGGAGIDTLDGGEGADTLIADDRGDRLDGGAGDDTYVLDTGIKKSGLRVAEAGGGGIDTVLTADDFELRGAEIEVVTATGDANVRITGNGGATAMTGNAGDNVLIAGGGGDRLAGGAGDDIFAFLRGDIDGPAARILDRDAGDRIALDDRLFGLGGSEVDVRDVTQAQIRASVKNGRAEYSGRTGELYVDLDGKRGPLDPVLLFTIEGGGKLAADDLLLF